MSRSWPSTLTFAWLAISTVALNSSLGEVYSAKNAFWPQRLEELTSLRETNIKKLGFDVSLRNERIIHGDLNQEPVVHYASGLASEEQRDCVLRQLKEAALFLHENKYQQYLKEKKVKVILLSVIDNSEGKAPDQKLKYGPELIGPNTDLEPDDKNTLPRRSNVPVLAIRPLLNSQHQCLIAPSEILSVSFDWWDQRE